jgi:hypothetical protein
LIGSYACRVRFIGFSERLDVSANVVNLITSIVGTPGLPFLREIRWRPVSPRGSKLLNSFLHTELRTLVFASGALEKIVKPTIQTLRSLPQTCPKLDTLHWFSKFNHWSFAGYGSSVVEMLEDILPQLNSLTTFAIHATSFAVELIPCLSRLKNLKVLVMQLLDKDPDTLPRLHPTSFPALEEVDLLGDLSECTNFVELLRTLESPRVFRLEVQIQGTPAYKAPIKFVRSVQSILSGTLRELAIADEPLPLSALPLLWKCKRLTHVDILLDTQDEGDLAMMTSKSMAAWPELQHATFFDQLPEECETESDNLGEEW